MTWDELQFKPEDFGLDEYYNQEDSHVQLTTWQATLIANRILKEKLEKAPLIFIEPAGTLMGAEEDADLYNGHWCKTIQSNGTARLVCIEEIKKAPEISP